MTGLPILLGVNKSIDSPDFNDSGDSPDFNGPAESSGSGNPNDSPGSEDILEEQVNADEDIIAALDHIPAGGSDEVTRVLLKHDSFKLMVQTKCCEILLPTIPNLCVQDFSDIGALRPKFGNCCVILSAALAKLIGENGILRDPTGRWKDPYLKFTCLGRKIKHLRIVKWILRAAGMLSTEQFLYCIFVKRGTWSHDCNHWVCESSFDGCFCTLGCNLNRGKCFHDDFLARTASYCAEARHSFSPCDIEASNLSNWDILGIPPIQA